MDKQILFELKKAAAYGRTAEEIATCLSLPVETVKATIAENQSAIDTEKEILKQAGYLR